MDDLKSILLSIAATIIYNFFHNLYKNKNVEKTIYSKAYVKSVKNQFYISFIICLLTLLIPFPENVFINTLVNFIRYICLSLILMSFMCATDVINFFSDNVSDTSSNDDENKS